MPGNNLRSVIQQCSVVSRRRFFSTTSSEVKKDDLWIVGLRRLMVAGMVLGPILKRGALIGVGYGIAQNLNFLQCSFLSRRRFSSSPEPSKPAIVISLDSLEKAVTNAKWMSFGFFVWSLLASRRMDQSNEELRDLADEKLG
ncbi:unnamed protein product [Microthlaspi erraticum]|uniref:Uncharacterized protein n=1 Tax=Microthlaspi erraticum TaxID=1685480 RepID=A0A6D2LJ52_9BRAS|nr:unnamed protein product [Microthlaspi erraticum]